MTTPSNSAYEFQQHDVLPGTTSLSHLASLTVRKSRYALENVGSFLGITDKEDALQQWRHKAEEKAKRGDIGVVFRMHTSPTEPRPSMYEIQEKLSKVTLTRQLERQQIIRLGSSDLLTGGQVGQQISAYTPPSGSLDAFSEFDLEAGSCSDSDFDLGFLGRMSPVWDTMPTNENVSATLLHQELFGQDEEELTYGQCVVYRSPPPSSTRCNQTASDSVLVHRETERGASATTARASRHPNLLTTGSRDHSPSTPTSRHQSLPRTTANGGIKPLTTVCSGELDDDVDLDLDENNCLPGTPLRNTKPIIGCRHTDEPKNRKSSDASPTHSASASPYRDARVVRRKSSVTFSPRVVEFREDGDPDVRDPDVNGTSSISLLSGLLARRRSLLDPSVASIQRPSGVARPSDVKLVAMTPSKSILKPMGQKGHADSSTDDNDFLQGTAALNHYRDFMKMERQCKTQQLFARKQAIHNRLMKKKRLIAEIIDLAKVHYGDEPEAERGSQWSRVVAGLTSLGSRQPSQSPNRDSRHLINKQLETLPTFTPWFTYIISTIQVLAFCVLIGRGGITSVGLEPELRLRTGVATFLGLETVEHWHQHNIWVGPSHYTIIRYGAVFAPCMRDDIGINLLYARAFNQTLVERLGCCYVVNRGIAGTTTDEECRYLTAGVGQWDSGSECGELSPEQPVATHMLKPCCYGVRGQCRLTTAEHCVFLEGTFFREGAMHCSQVNCLSTVCGLGGLEADPERPYRPSPESVGQWWRLALALVFHHGVLHLVLVVATQLLIGRPLETVAGWLRMALLYLIPGIMSLQVGAIFSPYEPQVGGSGAAMALLGVCLTELLLSWRLVKQPMRELTKLLFVCVLFLLSGTLPYVDNFVQLGGALCGVLCGVLFLPYVTFGTRHALVRRALIGVTVPVLCLLAFFTFFLFTTVQTVSDNCLVCRYINCLPYTKSICRRQELW